MATVVFTAHLARHVDAPTRDVPGGTLRSVLDAVFAENTALRGYILDDQGSLRRHVTVFVDGRRIRDREGLSDRVDEGSSIHVMQALSGG